MSSLPISSAQSGGPRPREYPERPIAGVGSVVLRRVEGRSQVLLVQRGSEPMAGCWSLPGGAIELGETAREGCIRETLEETGLRVEPVAAVETFDIIHRDPEGWVQYHYLIVDFLCHLRCEGSAAEPRPGSDASKAVWADAQRVLEDRDFALSARACTVIRRALDLDEGRA